LRNCGEKIADAGDRLKTLGDLADSFSTDIREGYLEQVDVGDRLHEIAEAYGLYADYGADAVQSIIADGLDRWQQRQEKQKRKGNGHYNGVGGHAPPPNGPTNDNAPLAWINMSSWDAEPVPEREWAIKDRVPLRQAGLFSGEGGTGKSILELMKDVAHVAGKDWLGSMPKPGPAFYIGAEDDVNEVHIRLAAIAKHYGVNFKELIAGGLHVLCLLGEDAVLCAAAGKSGRVEVTSLYRRLYQAAGDIKPVNISIDTLSRAFAGNEIDRVQVYAFAQHMQALAMAADGATTVLSHPSLQGISSGSGLSGSTAWHGAFRFRQYLTGIKPANGEELDSDIRELQFKKNQYGPTAEAIPLRYQRGLFLPEGGITTFDKLAREQKADDTFLALLGRYGREGRNVSDKPTANNFAPAAFSKEKDRNGFRRNDFEAAMRRLFAAGKIHVEEYGPASKHASRLQSGPKEQVFQ
jgi:RecA-family ATPase